MANGMHAKGVDLKRLVSGSYVTAGDVRAISGPNMTRAAVDVTHSNSTSGYREFVGGLRDPGEITLTLALVPSTVNSSGYKRMLADYDNDTPQTYRVEWPNGVMITFDALVTSVGHEQQPLGEDPMTQDVTFKISGKPTIS